jgi:ABC-type siderophore export system fused ATPase/permease subunit
MDYRGATHEKGFAMGPLNLAFRRGETVFVVGGNGSGKTTLMKLLVGLINRIAGLSRSMIVA